MNFKIRLFITFLSLMIAIPFVALGVETSGVIFLGGEYEVQSKDDSGDDDSGYNEFDISRVYLTVKDSFPEREGARFKGAYRATVDLKRYDDGYFVRVLKYAYVDLTHISTGVKIRLGQHGVPWVGYADKILGIRYISKSFPDRVKKLSSTDMGLSVLCNIPKGYGDIHVSIVNGEGYHKAEVSKHKDFMGRISVSPLPSSDMLKGLKLHGYYGLGTPDEDMVRNRLVGAASYQGCGVAILAEYLNTSDGVSNDDTDPTTGAGFGGSVVANLSEIMGGEGNHGLFAKVEKFDPNTDVDDDGNLRILAGIYCEVAKGLSFALDYEAKSYEEEGKDADGKIALHVQAKF